MHALVTGGAGFIGSHIAEKLLRERWHVTVLDNLESRVNFIPGNCEFLEKNICNVVSLPEVDAIVHCAARADISANWDSPGQRTWLERTNIHGTTTLLEAMGDRCRTFVFLSTCAVYNDEPEMSEEDLPVITSPYSASKLAGEAYVQAWAHAKSTRWFVARLSCVAGPRYHHGHVRDFVDMATHGGVIHAKNDGRTKKSFVHVEDVADAVFAMLAPPSLDAPVAPPSGIYNLATSEWSWRDTHAMMCELRGESIPLEYEHRTHGWIGDPMARVRADKIARYIKPTRLVSDGIRAALLGLGWPSRHCVTPPPRVSA